MNEKDKLFMEDINKIVKELDNYPYVKTVKDEDFEICNKYDRCECHEVIITYVLMK